MSDCVGELLAGVGLWLRLYATALRSLVAEYAACVATCIKVLRVVRAREVLRDMASKHYSHACVVCVKHTTNA